MKKLLIFSLIIFISSLFIACPEPVIQFNLTITIEGEGSVTANSIAITSGEAIKFNKDDIVTLVPTPKAGWKFDKWSGDDSADITSNQITMNEDKVITATFVEQEATYNLNVTIVPQQALDDGCSISYSPDTYPTFNAGQVVTMTPNNCTGWKFTIWGGFDHYNLTDNEDGTYSITMDTNRILEAQFPQVVDANSFSETFEGDGTWEGLNSNYIWTVCGYHPAVGSSPSMAPTIQSNFVHSGTYAAQLGPIQGGGESFFHINMNITEENKALSFYYLKNENDTLNYFIVGDNNEELGQIMLWFVQENTGTDWQYGEVPLSQGIHDIWIYGFYFGSGTFNNTYVDDIAIIDATPNMSLFYSSNIPNDGGVTPVNIGDIYSNTNVNFTIKNAGTGPLDISSVTLSGGGASEITLVDYPTTVENHNGKGAITFNVSAAGGPYTSGIVTINSNDPTNPTFQFAFSCNALETPILYENFDKEPFPPTGWTIYDVDGDGQKWQLASDVAYNDSAFSACHVYHYSVAQEGWLVTPAINLNGLTSASLSFFKCVYWTADYVYHGVWISTGSGNPADGNFVEIDEFGPGLFEWPKYEYDLSTYLGNTVYIAFKYSGAVGGNLYIDNFVVTGN